MHTEIKCLWSNNLLFNPTIGIFWMSSNIVQCKTILTKKVQYFEVMIIYIIAVNLHVRRNNVSLLVWVLVNFHFHWWYYNRHEFLLDWLCVHSWTHNLCIKQGESDLHCPQNSSCHDVFSTVFICKSRQTTNVSEMTRLLFGLFIFYISLHWAVLHS